VGLAESCRLNRAIAKDAVLTYADVELPSGRLCDKLRAEQDRYFALSVTDMGRPLVCETH
jgi:predicted homoserine dehydrogenase-like protein